eukprot:TRINITY_DN28081_c0_g1_i2.p1 TRINITY_DN28081_c0_g1~~TRINITY_DN28081_c0_g1_i2.p1  ORF type:complete len:458 (-),score=57.06 TRINITY_DN28081_c0_g1_i2:209-1582(-)
MESPFRAKKLLVHDAPFRTRVILQAPSEMPKAKSLAPRVRVPRHFQFPPEVVPAVGLLLAGVKRSSSSTRQSSQTGRPASGQGEGRRKRAARARKDRDIGGPLSLLSVGDCLLENGATLEPFLLLSASERWAGLMELELCEAWQASGRDASALERVASGLYRDRGRHVFEEEEEGALACASKVEAVLPSPRSRALESSSIAMELPAVEVASHAHTAGLRRRLRLLCPAQETSAKLIEAAAAACLSFPHGFSLESEGPCPAREESTAPYVSVSAHLPAALSRVIKGPLVQPSSEGCSDLATRRSKCEASHARLLVLETHSPRCFLLAEERPLPGGAETFRAALFRDCWRKRPCPDYSAALEPLAALALVTLGLRAHRAVHGTGSAPIAAILDPSCGTGTVAAAALQSRLAHMGCTHRVATAKASWSAARWRRPSSCCQSAVGRELADQTRRRRRCHCS